MSSGAVHKSCRISPSHLPWLSSLHSLRPESLRGALLHLHGGYTDLVMFSFNWSDHWPFCCSGQQLGHVWLALFIKVLVSACRIEPICGQMANIPLQYYAECFSLLWSRWVTEWFATAFGTHWCLMGNTDCQLWLKLIANHRQGQISKMNKRYSRRSGSSIHYSWAHTVLCAWSV